MCVSLIRWRVDSEDMMDSVIRDLCAHVKSRLDGAWPKISSWRRSLNRRRFSSVVHALKQAFGRVHTKYWKANLAGAPVTTELAAEKRKSGQS